MKGIKGRKGKVWGGKSRGRLASATRINKKRMSRGAHEEKKRAYKVRGNAIHRAQKQSSEKGERDHIRGNHGEKLTCALGGKTRVTPVTARWEKDRGGCE